MTYNLKNEYSKWMNQKEKEEHQLRDLGVNEEIILELRIVDKNLFNSNRQFYRNESVEDEEFFSNISNDYNFKDMSKLESVLDSMENELIYEIISNTDEVTRKIVELVYQGYECTEIAEILGISKYVIYRKLRKLKKLF